MKAILSFFKIYLGGALAASVIWLLGLTLRWNRHVPASLDPNNTQAKIFVFWHGHQLFVYKGYKNAAGRARGTFVLISEHRDGRLVAFAFKLLGLNSVAGSSTRGAVRSLVSLLKKLEQGHCVAITPDGPRGPIYKLKPGVIALAQKSGAPIYILSTDFEKKWQLKSWDKMQIPKPFTKAYFAISEAIYIPSQLDMAQHAEYAQKLEDQINQMRDFTSRFLKNA